MSAEFYVRSCAEIFQQTNKDDKLRSRFGRSSSAVRGQEVTGAFPSHWSSWKLRKIKGDIRMFAFIVGEKHASPQGQQWLISASVTHLSWHPRLAFHYEDVGSWFGRLSTGKHPPTHMLIKRARWQPTLCQLEFVWWDLSPIIRSICVYCWDQSREKQEAVGGRGLKCLRPRSAVPGSNVMFLLLIDFFKWVKNNTCTSEAVWFLFLGGLLSIYHRDEMFQLSHRLLNVGCWEQPLLSTVTVSMCSDEFYW